MKNKEILYFLDEEVEVLLKPRLNGLTLRMHPDRPMWVRTNLKTKPEDIIKFLMSKKNWIEKNLSKFDEINTKFKRPELIDGEFFPFLGELKYFQFSSTYKSTGTTDEDLLKKLNKFYKTKAEEYLSQRTMYWSEVTGLKPLKLVFRSNQTRWGSCSSHKQISLNWKLICQSPALIDYVIVHELCHLQHLNHSPLFWKLVESFLSSYESIEKVLNDQQMLGRFLD
ncbi:MAG: SprT family zinc-dependent metalloprotease [Pseudobdellovibrio sp.]